jgi:hypothetical protein
VRRILMATNSSIKIWIWVQNYRVLKAISNQEAGTLTIYDEYDNILIRRIGLSKQQVKVLETLLSNFNVKRLDDHKEPYTYL